MTAEVLVPVLFYDMLRIWIGLFYFLAMLFVLPGVLKTIDTLIISIFAFAVYILRELSQYFLPSGQQLRAQLHQQRQAREQLHQQRQTREQLHQRRQTREQLHQQRQATDSSENEDPLYNLLRIIGGAIDNPRTIIAAIVRDFNCRDRTENIIKHKFKIGFIILATIGASLILFYPPLASFFKIDLFCKLLLERGIAPQIAKYALTVVTGGFVYSLRAPLVGLALGIAAKCCGWKESAGDGANEEGHAHQQGSVNIVRQSLSAGQRQSNRQEREQASGRHLEDQASLGQSERTPLIQPLSHSRSEGNLRERVQLGSLSHTSHIKSPSPTLRTNTSDSIDSSRDGNSMRQRGMNRTVTQDR